MAGSPEGHSVHGFTMYRAELDRALGMTVELVETSTLDDVERTLVTRPADVAFVMVHWAEPAEDVAAMFRRVGAMPDRPKMVYLDYCASSTSPHFGVLPHVDRFAKRQVLRDKAAFNEDFEGGCLFTDYLARGLGIDLQGWTFGSQPDPSLVHKVVPSWNLGLSPRYRGMLKLSRALPLPWEWRPFAVNCRLNAGSRDARKDWYDEYRMMSVDAIAPLRQEYRCTDVTRVGRKRFLAEMFLSKVVFSPFGWGETCFRDFEAVCAGALLIKPSMDHLRTSPNIYVAGQTYVACRWDLSDLPDLCRHYLAHPEEARRIIANAQGVMSQYFEDGGFVGDVRRVLDGVIPLPEPASRRAVEPQSMAPYPDQFAHPAEQVHGLISY